MSIHSSNPPESLQKQDVTTSTISKEFKTVRDLREEVILVFYNSMLDLVVREWNRVNEDDNISESRKEKVEDQQNTKDFKDLTRGDLETHEVTSVTGSKISLSRRNSRRSSSGSLSRARLARRSTSFTKRGNKIMENPSKLDEYTSFSLALTDSNDPFHWLLDTYPETVEILFKNGNVYRGRVERKRFHGYGSFFWTNGTVYEGEFHEGYITGRGKLYFKDCSYYKGSFCKGLLHGEGCMYIMNTNQLYSGDWKGGKKNGKGWLLYGLNNWYDGEWLDDQRHGQGIRQYDKTAMYEGDWYNGVRQGSGTMVWSNHDYYKGQWENGTMHGYGEYIWRAFFNQAFVYPLINKFAGNWIEGTRTGEGSLDFGFRGGARMRGCWIRNMKHGPAVVVCGNGKTVVGTPLFLYDKPVNPNIWYGTEQPSTSLLSGLSADKLSYLTSIDKISSGSYSHVTVSLSDFPKVNNDPINPLCIPVHYEPKHVDLSYYLYLFAEKFKLCESVYKEEILSTEETKLRNVILSNNVALKHIYLGYAHIACPHDHKFRAVMIRMFLWQLYFDVDLSSKGMTLIDTDLCLFKNPNCAVETKHDPFERIFFWQFLLSLVGVAWQLYNDTFQLDIVEGTFAKILRKFIYDDLTPNIGKSKGTALCEYKDLLPIQGVYMLYKSIGDLPTARMLYKSFITKGCPLCSEKILDGDEIKYLKPGSNITAIGTTVMFLPDDADIGSKPSEPKPYPFKHDNMVLSNLHIFTKMKRKTLIECIAQICPPVVKNGFIVNIDYPITFLEFYNIILLITSTKIEDVRNREQLKEEMKLAQQAEEQVPQESKLKVSKQKGQKEKKDKKK